MRAVAVANHKGGVGKTVSVYALAVGLAERGRRVLMVDIDPQGSLTNACGVQDAGGRSLAEVLGGASKGSLALADILWELGQGLDLAPADIALAQVELALNGRHGREWVLLRALDTVADRYDVCLIDCPPSLGLLTVNALCAAQAVLVPTAPEILPLRGLRLFLDTLDTIRQELNPNLELLGVLPTLYDARLTHHRSALDALQAGGVPLLPVQIARSIRLSEAANAGESILTYEPGSAQAAAYRQVAERIDTWASAGSK